jgi:hypothetical protein
MIFRTCFLSPPFNGASMSQLAPFIIAKQCIECMIERVADGHRGNWGRACNWYCTILYTFKHRHSQHSQHSNTLVLKSVSLKSIVITNISLSPASLLQTPDLPPYTKFSITNFFFFFLRQGVSNLGG